MNKRLTLIPITGLLLLTVAGCGTTGNGPSANGTTGNKTPSTAHSSRATSDRSNYAYEIAVIAGKGYSVNGTTPSASVKTTSGAYLSAWLGLAGQDGHNQFVFFFLNGKFVGTGNPQPSVEITSAKPAGQGSIAVTYPVYKKNDAFAAPSGTPVTITYHWDGSKLTQNKPYPKQFR